MDKKFIKVPDDIIERVMLAVGLVEGLKNEKVPREEIIKALRKENIEITAEILERIESR